MFKSTFTSSILTLSFLLPLFSYANQKACENETAACTITENDFQQLVQARETGLAGFQHNVDHHLLVPASETAVINWSEMPKSEKERLSALQDEMFRRGKISLIVLAGGEATRFGGPKTFITVSDELGEFLEIKTANLKWMRNTYGAKVPLYMMTSEKRLAEVKESLEERRYYGLDPEDIRLYVQGTVDTFIPTDEELAAHYSGKELEHHLVHAAALREAYPDGIYRFNGERRKVPPGHFDALAGFIISGLLSEALAQGIEFAPIVNIDNLQAIMKDDGMIACCAERGDDFCFLMAEKNLTLTISDRKTGQMIHPKLLVRFRDRALSFNGIDEFKNEADHQGKRFVINQEEKTVDVFDAATGTLIETDILIKSETGGTLVQPLNEQGQPVGKPVIKEGFELPSDFDHASASFFNTNTLILQLRSLLKFLDVTEEHLAALSFEERSILVREKLIKNTKAFFEFKQHEVEGEYPEWGSVKEGKTKILVSQITRILLQAAHLADARVNYIFAPRAEVFAPVKEPEDLKTTAERHKKELKRYIMNQNW